MNSRPLGQSGLMASELGFGGWQLGGKGWGPFRADEATKAVKRALELGINLFDTAPVYGFGRAEELLGKALPRDPDRVVLVSKGGLRWDERGRVRHDNRPESLALGLEGSLRRLRRERLDVLLLHWPDPQVPLVDSVASLELLCEAGKIRAWGLSNFPAREVLWIEARAAQGQTFEHGPVLSYPVNLFGEYAAEHASSGAAGREILGVAARRGWGFIAFDALERGLLGGRYDEKTRFSRRDLRSSDRRFHAEAFRRNLGMARELSVLAAACGVPPAALAIRSVLNIPGVTSCLVGMRSPQQVEECALASEVSIGEEVRDALRRMGGTAPG